MKEKYDRVNVDRFVEDVNTNLNDDKFFHFLILVNRTNSFNRGTFVSINIAPREFFGIWDEVMRWNELTTWERANALFELASRAQEVVLKRARALSKLARKEEEGD